jgi:hypothetical protein
MLLVDVLLTELQLAKLMVDLRLILQLVEQLDEGYPGL